MSDVIVTAKNVSKKYAKNLKHSIYYGISDAVGDIIGKPSATFLRTNEFWALQDISFEIKKGECLGVVGLNGAGKSTLLKIINGIIKPDSGYVKIQGSVSGLIELGAGFHPMLSGRENIYINGAILGLTKREIDNNLEEIIDFSEIGDFIDMPIKFYSSGMYVRLGFAIAAQIRPDILILDEILAVGDARFRAKCYDLIYSHLPETAVIFVSHDMVHVKRMCSSVLVLDHGKADYFSNTSEGIQSFLSIVDLQKSSSSFQHSNGKIKIENIKVKGTTEDDRSIVKGDRLSVEFEILSEENLKECSIILSVLSRDLNPIAYVKSKRNEISMSNNKHFISFTIPNLPLVPGKYSIAIAITDESRLNQLLWYYNVSPFTVGGEDDYVGVPVSLIGSWEMK